MDYPFKTVFVVGGIAVAECVQYQPGGIATGPDGSTSYDFAADNPVTIGWRCLVDDGYTPPQIAWRPPA